MEHHGASDEAGPGRSVSIGFLTAGAASRAIVEAFCRGQGGDRVCRRVASIAGAVHRLRDRGMPDGEIRDLLLGSAHDHRWDGGPSGEARYAFDRAVIRGMTGGDRAEAN